MSRRTLKTVDGEGRPVQGVLGWDRIFGGYHLSVQLEDGSDDPSPVYDHLKTAEPFPSSLDQYEVALTEMGIVLPDEMLDDLLDDCRRNAGNVVAAYEDPLFDLVRVCH